MKCPVCQVELKIADRLGIEMDYCPNCRGDCTCASEPLRTGILTAMKCPVCQVELKIADRLGIEIDYCPNCRGVWLDRGELDKLIERAHQEIAPSAPPPARGASPPPRYDDDEPHDYPERPHHDPYPRHKRRKKRNWLEDLFDVFD